MHRHGWGDGWAFDCAVVTVVIAITVRVVGASVLTKQCQSYGRKGTCCVGYIYGYTYGYHCDYIHSQETLTVTLTLTNVKP